MYQGLLKYIQHLESVGERLDPISAPRSSYPVASHLFNSEKRILHALGFESEEELEERADSFRSAILDITQGFTSSFRIYTLARSISSWIPDTVKNPAECQGFAKYTPDILNFPHLHWSGENLILKSAIVHTMSAGTGRRSCGLYDIKTLNSETATISFPEGSEAAEHLAEVTHRLPVAITLGGDPIYTLIAALDAAKGMDKFAIAGFLRDKPVKLTQCFTQLIKIPADSDIVIEGYIQKSEGIFHSTCITHRKDAIFPDIPAADELMSSAAMSFLQKAIRF